MKHGLAVRWISLIALSCFFFLYAPILVVVINAFNQSRIGNSWDGFTLDWFSKLFENKMLLEALKNSLSVALVSTFVSTILGTSAAVALVRGTFVGKTIFKSLVKLPLILPDIVLGISSLVLFSLISFPLGIESVMVAHITFNIAFVALIVSAKVASLDERIEMAAEDLGATPRQVFFRVTLPQLYPSMIAGGLLAFSLSLDDYVISSFTAGVGGTTLPMRIYSMIKFGVTPEVNALSTILLLVSILIALMVSRVDRGTFVR